MNMLAKTFFLILGPGKASLAIHSRYELVESWSQTLDFSKKKKGTQCDDIETEEMTTQVSTKDFLDEERKRKKQEEEKNK